MIDILSLNFSTQAKSILSNRYVVACSEAEQETLTSGLRTVVNLCILKAIHKASDTKVHVNFGYDCPCTIWSFELPAHLESSSRKMLPLLLFVRAENV